MKIEDDLTKEDNMEEKLKSIIAQIRPGLQADGGDIELVGVRDGIVSVRLVGACVNCPMSSITLKNGVERFIRSEMPEVKEVVAV
jgi:Fe-S cluster biogenesis protein NfuA